MKMQWQDPSEFNSYLLEEGGARFKILSVSEYDENGNPRMSKKTGEEMVRVEFEVTDINQKKAKVFEYLLGSQAWKLYNICASIGKLDIYEDCKNGPVNFNRLLGGVGMCIVATQKSDNPAYKDRTVITKYDPAPEPMSEKEARAVESAVKAEFDDAIPF